jgi:uncharacterized protein (DUF302 family)
MKNYWYGKEIMTSFEEALDDVTIALWQEWFGVMTKINMKEKMKEKLGKYIEEYMILWACNPFLANKALEVEYEIWLLLPCNVIVYKKDWRVFASTILASSLVNNSESEIIREVAEEADKKLKKVIDSI